MISDSLKYVSLEFEDYELYKLVQRDFKLFFKRHNFQSLNMCMSNVFNCLEDSVFKKYFVKEDKNYSVLINLCGVADKLLINNDLKTDYVLDVYQEDMDSIYFDGNYHIIRMLDGLESLDSAIYFIITSEDNFNVAKMFEEQLRVKKCVSFIFIEPKKNDDIKMIINKFRCNPERHTIYVYLKNGHHLSTMCAIFFCCFPIGISISRLEFNVTIFSTLNMSFIVLK